MGQHVNCSSEISCRIANMSVWCSFLVVLAHAGHPTPGSALAWTSCFVYENLTFPVIIPFFAFVSGYFLARHVDELSWYGKEIQKRFRTLVVPFFAWSVAYFCLMLGLGCLMDIVRGERIGLTFLNCFGNLLTSFCLALGLDLTEAPLLTPLWYLRVLFVFCLVSPLVVWFMSRNCRLRLAVSFIPMILTLWVVSKLAPNLKGYFMWTFQFGYLWFFMLGVAVRRDPRFTLSRPAANILLSLGVVFIVVSMLGVRSFSIGSAANVLLIDGLKPLCLTYLTWRLMPAIRLPAWLASSAFAIYVIHCLFIGAWDVVVGSWPSVNGAFLIKFVLGLVGSVLLVNALRRFFPKIAEISLGGR